jgi:hypothetical protein
MPALRRAVIIPAALTGLALTVVVTARIDPDWVREAGLDVWNQPARGREAKEVAATTRRLERELDMIRHRIEIKERLVAALIEGRATLAEVAAQFLALDQDQEAWMLMLRAKFPGGTDEEKIARNVIQYTLAKLADPFAKERVAWRLRTEFRVMFPAADEPAGEPAPFPVLDPPELMWMNSGGRRVPLRHTCLVGCVYRSTDRVFSFPGDAVLAGAFSLHGIMPFPFSAPQSQSREELYNCIDFSDLSTR